MIRFVLLCLLALAPVLFVVACGDDNTTVNPRPAPRCGTVFESSINEAQKGEAEMKIDSLITALRSASISGRYNRDLNKLANDVSGPLSDATAQKLGFADASSFNGTWYKSSDFWVEYMGSGKFWIHVKPAADPMHISKEVLIR
jgi:hypothetical protein